MAGHSKWANIKHRKARQDAKKGKVFTKLIKELTIAAKSGAIPADNPRLRLALDKALAANMTRDTIDRAIARGAGSNDVDNMLELSYEGYAHGGVAVFVEAMTDNKNRTAAEVRHVFNKCGGNLGTDGSVAYMFDLLGQIHFDASTDENKLIDAALEADASDVQIQEDGNLLVITEFVNFHTVNDALKAAGFIALDAEISMVPNITTEITDTEVANELIKLIDMLEDSDDVQNVYHNADIPDDILKQLD